MKKPDIAVLKRYLKLIPDANAIIQSNMPVNAAVLKFGCFIINKIIDAKIVNQKIFFLNLFFPIDQKALHFGE